MLVLLYNLYINAIYLYLIYSPQFDVAAFVLYFISFQDVAMAARGASVRHAAGTLETGAQPAAAPIHPTTPSPYPGLPPGKLRRHLFRNSHNEVPCLACVRHCGSRSNVYIECAGCSAPIHVECLKKARSVHGKLFFVCVLCRLQDPELNRQAMLPEEGDHPSEIPSTRHSTLMCIECWSEIGNNDAVFCIRCRGWYCFTECSVMGLLPTNQKPAARICRPCAGQEAADRLLVAEMRRLAERGTAQAKSLDFEFNTDAAAFVQMMHAVYTQAMTDVYEMFSKTLQELVRLELQKIRINSESEVVVGYLPIFDSTQFRRFPFATERDAFAFANAHANAYFILAGSNSPVDTRGKSRKKRRISHSGKPTVAFVTSDWTNHPTRQMLLEVLKLVHESTFDVVLCLYVIQDKEILPETQRFFGRENVIDISNMGAIASAKKILGINAKYAVYLDGHTGSKQHHWAALEHMVEEEGYDVVLFCYLADAGIYGGSKTATIADHTVVPRQNEDLYRHGQVVFMRGTYHRAAPVRPREVVEEAVQKGGHSKTIHGFPAESMVLGFPGRPGRLNTETMDSICRLKARIGDILKLYLVAHNCSAKTILNIFKYLLKKGFPPEDIVFGQQLSAEDDALRMAVTLDGVLDTRVGYGLHSQFSDALRLGVPGVTCVKDSSGFHELVAASILQALDLKELITTTTEQFEDVLYRVLTDVPFRETLRAKLLPEALAQSAVFDPKQGARDLVDCMLSSAMSRLQLHGNGIGQLSPSAPGEQNGGTASQQPDRIGVSDLFLVCRSLYRQDQLQFSEQGSMLRTPDYVQPAEIESKVLVWEWGLGWGVVRGMEDRQIRTSL